MTIGTVLAFVLVIAVIWYWQNTMRAREMAFAVCKTLCQAQHLQLLDETVTLRKTRLKRHANGRWCLYRRYSFDYTVGDGSRHSGEISLLGKHLHEQQILSHHRIVPPGSTDESSTPPSAKIIPFRSANAQNDKTL